MTESARPVVAICMGSRSDLPTMDAASRVLREFEVPFETRILSAHRTPDRMFDYGQRAISRGLEVIIAGAGGAAHLPGMLAAMTVLPVIGVPVSTPQLGGLDSLLSIVQMPPGTPVATVAIGNATNAAHLALRILSATRPALRAALEREQQATATRVRREDDELFAMSAGTG